MITGLRPAVRALRRQPGVTVVASLSLALGLGASIAMFSLADALFLRPLDVTAPEQLVHVQTLAETGRPGGLSFAEFEDVTTQVASFSGAAAFDRRGATFKDGDELELLLLTAVSDNYFALLGVKPALGRAFRADADRALEAPGILISHSLWTRRFGRDASLVNRTVRLSDRLYTVIGVLPAGFNGLDRGPVSDVWINLDTWTQFYGSRATLAARGERHFSVVARLRPGATLAQARAELQVLGDRWTLAYPATNARRGLTARPADDVSGAAGRAQTALLLAIVGLVLIIACANVTGLLLAQGDARRHEFGIRLAVGAGGARLVRQLLGEGLLRTALGLTGGLLIASWLIDMAPALLPPGDMMLDFGIRLDARVLAFALLLAAIATLLSGLVPALRAARTDIVASLKADPLARPRGRRLSLHSALVAGQIALAVVLLNTSLLLLASFLATRANRPGFDPAKPLLVLQLALGGEGAGRQTWPTLLAAIRERAGALPGVRHATYVRRVPMAGYGGGATLPVSAIGTTSGPGSEPRGLRYNQAGPGYLETMGTRLLRGRFFAAHEHTSTARVVVISETLARDYFGEQDPIGRSLRIEADACEIVGVVEDARVNQIHEPAEPFFYLPYAVRPSSDVALVVETVNEPAALASAVKQAVREVSGRVMILRTTTMREHMGMRLHADWLPAVLGAALSALGVALALVGVYAAVSFLTGRRRREFGVRLALGAPRRGVLGLVLWQGVLIAAVGGAAGLLGAAAAAQGIRSFLYGVSAFDAVALAASATAAMVIGVLASVAPAWRATRLDPSRTLREP